MDPKLIAQWIGIVFSVGTIVAGIVKFGFWVHDELKKRRSGTANSFNPPKDTLRVVPNPDERCLWHMGSNGQDPTMHVVGQFFVTNISSTPVRIPQAEIRFGFFGRRRVFGSAMVEGQNHFYGMYDIPPNTTRDAQVSFWVFPPCLEANHPFIAKRIVLYDQFGNGHQLKNVQFDYL